MPKMKLFKFKILNNQIENHILMNCWVHTKIINMKFEIWFGICFKKLKIKSVVELKRFTKMSNRLKYATLIDHKIRKINFLVRPDTD